MGQSNYVHLDGCDVVRTTERAVLIFWDDEEHWIPRSQIAGGDKVKQGENVSLSISEWIAEQKGIEAE